MSSDQNSIMDINAIDEHESVDGSLTPYNNDSKPNHFNDTVRSGNSTQKDSHY